MVATGITYGHMDGGAWWAMMIFWVIIAAVLVWAVARTLSSGGTPTTPPGEPARPTAGDVLAERYARGEIDDEEYVRRRDLLSE